MLFLLYGLIHNIYEMMKGLPLYVQMEVRDFLAFLQAKHIHKPTKPLRQDWTGGLSQYHKDMGPICHFNFQ